MERSKVHSIHSSCCACHTILFSVEVIPLLCFVGGTNVDTRSRSQIPTCIRSSNADVAHVHRRNPTQPDFSSASIPRDQVVDNVLHMPDGFDEKLVQECMEFTIVHGAGIRSDHLKQFQERVTITDLNQLLRMNDILPFGTFEDLLKQFKDLLRSKADVQDDVIVYKTSDPNYYMNKLFHNLKTYGSVRMGNVKNNPIAYKKLTLVQYQVLVDIVYQVSSSLRNKPSRELTKNRRSMQQLIIANLDSLMNIKFDLGSLVRPSRISRKLARQAYEKGLPSYVGSDTANTCSSDTAHVYTVSNTPTHRCSTCPSIPCNDTTCGCAPSVNRVSTTAIFEDDTPSAVNTFATNIVSEDDTPSVARMFLVLFLYTTSPLHLPTHNELLYSKSVLP